MSARRRLATRLAGAALGGALARGSLAVGRAATPPGTTSTDRWSRTNYRGSTVSLLGGPAYAAGATAGLLLSPGLGPRLRAAAVVATATSGVVGLLDDLAGSGGDRGLRGHLDALRRGTVTTGVVKVVGLGAAGVVAARLLGHRAADAAVSGAVIAGSANLLNLLDLRPGRALKAAILHAPALVDPRAGATAFAVPLGAAVALLPDDLRERTMLGDAGANALGAALGVAAVATYGRIGRLAHLAVLVALTLTSERVSFTRVIEATRPLRWLDGLGHQP